MRWFRKRFSKISGAIDTANVDVDSSMEEHLAALDERMGFAKCARAPKSRSARLDELHVLQFLSESRYRELKSKFGNVFQANMGAEAFYEILSGLNHGKAVRRIVARGAHVPIQAAAAQGDEAPARCRKPAQQPRPP